MATKYGNLDVIEQALLVEAGAEMRGTDWDIFKINGCDNIKCSICDYK